MIRAAFRRLGVLAGAATLAAALCACGQKGPLKLPEPTPAKPASSAP